MKRHKLTKPRLWALCALGLLAFAASVAYAQVAGGLDLSWNTIDGGGGTFSTGGSYSLGGTIGQPDAGVQTGGRFSLTGGFWGGAASAQGTPTPSATATPTDTPVVVASTTPTGTPTATSTPAVSPTAVLVVHVTWQGIPQPNSRNTTETITMTLRSTSGGPATDFAGFTTDASGFVTFPVGSLVAGSYNVRVKGPRNLATCGQVSLTGAASTSVEMGTQPAGDADNSNLVSSTDFVALKNSFGKSAGQPGYDARADFDNNDLVTSVDFNLLKTNFGQSGCAAILNPSGSDGSSAPPPISP
jgi:hypothetical protein